MRLRSLARGAGLLLTGCALAWGALHVSVERRLARVYPVRTAELRVPNDPAALMRGRHWVEVVGQCTTCHAADLAGGEMVDDPWVGRLWAPNLTPGRGGIAARSDEELARSIRFGVDPVGRPLLVMPAQHFFHLRDADLADIIAWLRQLPRVDRSVPERRVGPLARLVIASGRAPDLIPAELLARGPARMRPPEPAASAAYGAYLAETAGCKLCHRTDLAGGPHPLALPGEPPPTDIRPRGPLAAWSEADFVRALRSGRRPDGSRLDPAWMPWPSLGRMSDLELRAIWLYLRSLGPTQTVAANGAAASAR